MRTYAIGDIHGQIGLLALAACATGGAGGRLQDDHSGPCYALARRQSRNCAVTWSASSSHLVRVAMESKGSARSMSFSLTPHTRFSRNAMGIVGAAGSLGQFLMLPYGQLLINHLGWQQALLALDDLQPQAALWACGHSLGCALSSLAVPDLRRRWPSLALQHYNFASPRPRRKSRKFV